MKLNHLFIAALALGLTQSALFAGEGDGEPQQQYPTEKPRTEGGSEKRSTGLSKVSIRGVTASAVSRVSTARPTASRTASLSRVNLRRPTATTTTGGNTQPAGGGQSVGGN